MVFQSIFFSFKKKSIVLENPFLKLALRFQKIPHMNRKQDLYYRYQMFFSKV